MREGVIGDNDLSGDENTAGGHPYPLFAANSFFQSSRLVQSLLTGIGDRFVLSSTPTT
jgi:hypothetical protein